MLHQDIVIKAEVAVIRLGIEEEEIGQPLLGDEPFKVSHVGVADASLSDEKTQPQLCCESVKNQPNSGRPCQAGGI